MDDEGESRGLLGEYGVLIVPPDGESESWFVTLGAWDGETGGYITGTMGPFFDTREEAQAEAGRILDWLAEHADDDADLLEAWEKMQEMSSADSGLIDRSNYRPRGPMGL